MSKDKPRYMIYDKDTEETIYCDKIDGTILSWIYLHYVEMDGFVRMKEYNIVKEEYVPISESCDEQLTNLLKSMYFWGLISS